MKVHTALHDWYSKGEIERVEEQRESGENGRGGIGRFLKYRSGRRGQVPTITSMRETHECIPVCVEVRGGGLHKCEESELKDRPTVLSPPPATPSPFRFVVRTRMGGQLALFATRTEALPLSLPHLLAHQQKRSSWTRIQTATASVYHRTATRRSVWLLLHRIVRGDHAELEKKSTASSLASLHHPHKQTGNEKRATQKFTNEPLEI